MANLARVRFPELKRTAPVDAVPVAHQKLFEERLERELEWQSAAARLKREVEGRTHMDQSEIDAGDRAESTLGRYGLRGLR